MWRAKWSDSLPLTGSGSPALCRGRDHRASAGPPMGLQQHNCPKASPPPSPRHRSPRHNDRKRGGVLVSLHCGGIPDSLSPLLGIFFKNDRKTLKLICPPPPIIIIILICYEFRFLSILSQEMRHAAESCRVFFLGSPGGHANEPTFKHPLPGQPVHKNNRKASSSLISPLDRVHC